MATEAIWPGGQSAIESVLVEEAAARGVDQADALLHHAYLVVADHVQGLFGARGVDADVVGLTQQLLEVDLLDVQLLETGVGDVGVVGDHPHLKAAGALRDQPADAAQADDAQGLAVQLAALELLAPPLTALDEAVGPDDVAAACQHQADGVLGRRHHVALGGVADYDALLGGIGDIYVVQTRARSAHDLHVGGGVEEVLVDEGLAADDDAVVLGDDGKDLFFAEAVLDVHLAVLGELGDGIVFHQFGH